MTVLVLGAGGFIGPHVVRALEALGVEAVGISRGGGPPGAACDRRDVLGVRAIARGRRARAVVDLLAYTAADTEPLLAAMDGEVERWVMASSGDVYRNYEGLQRLGSPPVFEGRAAEDAPLRTRLYPYRTNPPRAPDAADAWMDAYDKIPLERTLLARPGLDGVAMRLPMVFGPGDRQHRFAWALAPMRAGRERLEADPRWLAWRTTYGYVADVAHALATAAVSERRGGRVYNLGLAEACDHVEWIRRFAAATGWGGRIAPAPAPPGSPVDRLDLRYPLDIDSGAFRRDFGWTEPTRPESALEATIADAARPV